MCIKEKDYQRQNSRLIFKDTCILVTNYNAMYIFMLGLRE